MWSLTRAIEGADCVRLAAWTFRSHRLVRALEAAAGRGADVVVALEREPFAGSKTVAQRLEKHNARLAGELHAHGVDARLIDDDGAPFHLKAALVDGVAYLDDRNWASTGPQTIVRTRRHGDVAAIEREFDRVLNSSHETDEAHSTSLHDFAVRKDSALALEADLIQRTPRDVPVYCASEFVLPNSKIANALVKRARAGDRVEVLVDGSHMSGKSGRRESAELRRLSKAGADVRIGQSSEKLCVAGDIAWVGSANATAGFPNTVDWGLCTRSAPIVAALAQRFHEAWECATPLPRHA